MLSQHVHFSQEEEERKGKEEWFFQFFQMVCSCYFIFKIFFDGMMMIDCGNYHHARRLNSFERNSWERERGTKKRKEWFVWVLLSVCNDERFLPPIPVRHIACYLFFLLSFPLRPPFFQTSHLDHARRPLQPTFLLLTHRHVFYFRYTLSRAGYECRCGVEFREFKIGHTVRQC